MRARSDLRKSISAVSHERAATWGARSPQLSITRTHVAKARRAAPYRRLASGEREREDATYQALALDHDSVDTEPSIAIDDAALDGHFDVVQWLHANRFEDALEGQWTPLRGAETSNWSSGCLRPNRRLFGAGDGQTGDAGGGAFSALSSPRRLQHGRDGLRCQVWRLRHTALPARILQGGMLGVSCPTRCQH
ncbi:hypothetical protein PybrP1_001452 [[Pythium] brassicae (nom. inval.)]|nr:hypothetical protein PybrP1_001452 [[Pythium] brassicae (nom. inval.)]